MGFFDDILRAAPAEDQAILAKYPQLKQSMDQLEGEVAKLAPWAQYGAQWKEWEGKYWDEEAGMTKREKELADELATAQARLTSAQGAGASAGEIASLRTDFDAKLKAVSENHQRSLEGMNYFYSRAYTKMLPHQQEFGEVLDPKSLYEFMQKSGLNDPDIAYDRMVEGRRKEIAVKRQQDQDELHKKEILEAEQRGRDAAAKELAMGPAGSLPTDGTGGIAGVTAYTKPAALPDETKAKLAEAKLGDGSLAAVGYEMYRRGELPAQ